MLKSQTSRVAVVLAGASLLAITPFFWRGSPSGHDFEFHMFSWMEVLGQWKHGIVYPRWAAGSYWGYGEARFLFYPPASWTLGAALGAILPWRVVPGAYCWTVLTLAGAAMYRLVRAWLRPPDAIFAAVFYALNPYHLLIVYWRSAYAELLAAVLLPLLLLCLLRLNEAGSRPTLCLSLVLAAAWLTNVPGAVMIYYSAAGLAVVLAARLRSQPPQAWRLLVRTALAMSLGAGLASVYLVPAIYEQGWINIGEVMSPGVRPQDNFLFTMLADADHNRFNLLVSSVAVAEIAVLIFAIWIFATRLSKTKQDAGTVAPSVSSGQAPGFPVSSGAIAASVDRNSWLLLSVWGAASATLMLSVSNLLWLHLPKFRFVQLPFRWLLCMNVALAILLTMSAKRWRWRLLVCAYLLVAVVLTGYRTQPPWWDTGADIREMTETVAGGAGYEGTDEYVPAKADASELNKGLPRISDKTGASVASKVLTWEQEEKHFTVHAATPQNLTVRLFNYPAWEARVNGKPTATRTTDVTGLIIIPVAAGESDVQISFRRTVDRLAGDVTSLISLAVLLAAWAKSRPRPATSQL